jgi:XTP/dITP diphosphohydrolase
MKLKIITSNPGKVTEYREALSQFGIDTEHFEMPYDEIQTSELKEVVRSGMGLLKISGITDFIIDDSGMFIDHLQGFPGVYSAYVQKTIGNAGILKLMENADNRKANFQCCIGCNIRNHDVIVLGKCDGMILREERGNEGFGYDPVFSHDGKRSFAEIPLTEKNGISHRGNAVRFLVEKIEQMLGL